MGLVLSERMFLLVGITGKAGPMGILAPPQTHLLVVEDDLDTRELITTVLTDEGYRISEAHSPAEALAQVNTHLFQAILTDLFDSSPATPWKSIQPLLKVARPTPVGVITAWQVSTEAILRDGFACLLHKPFELDELLTVVTTCLSSLLDPARQQQAQAIQRTFEALDQGDWAALRLLWTEDVNYYLLTPGSLSLPKAIRGREALIAWLQECFANLPGWRVEAVNIYQGKKDIGARFQWSWRGPDGRRRQMIDPAIFRFRGERILQIGLALNTQKLAARLNGNLAR